MQGSGSFTSTSAFVAIAKAGATTSFAIVSATGHLLTKTSTGVVNNGTNMIMHDIWHLIILPYSLLNLNFPFIFYLTGLLQINPAKPIEDYHAENVQTSYELSTSDVMFEGIIEYDVAHSECAVHSKASWVVLDPTGAGANSMGDDEDEDGAGEVLETVQEDSNEGPVDEGSGGFEEAS